MREKAGGKRKMRKRKEREGGKKREWEEKWFNIGIVHVQHLALGDKSEEGINYLFLINTKQIVLLFFSSSFFSVISFLLSPSFPVFLSLVISFLFLSYFLSSSLFVSFLFFLTFSLLSFFYFIFYFLFLSQILWSYLEWSDRYHAFYKCH